MYFALYAFWIFIGLTVLITLVAWVRYVPLIVRIFGETPWLYAQSFAPLSDGEECEFPTSDGLTLRGTYLPNLADERLGVIAYCHEMTGDRWGARPYVADLRQKGFDIFTFDFRNHGRSDRQPGYEPMPWMTEFELNDVLGVVNYLGSRPDADPRGIGMIGVSKGANAALCAAACDSRILALVTDGAFPTDGMQRHYIRRFMFIYAPFPRMLSKLPDWCLVSFCKWTKYLTGQRRRCRLLDVEQAARRVRQPVFMIHGERDNYVPLDVVQALRACIAGRTKLWIVPRAKHNGSVGADPEAYHRRVARFFVNRLVGQRIDATHPPATRHHPVPMGEPLS